MRDQFPIHGRRWRPWTPLRFVCRCGVDAFPCPAERERQAVEERQAVREREARAAIQLYAAGRRAAAGWQRAERRNWARRG